MIVRRHVVSRLVCAALALSTATCETAPPGPIPNPHYVLGPAYKVGSTWYYPKDTLNVDETGIAAVIAGDKPRLTADGEVFDQTALIAAHPTLQLPAIARLTNLENGRSVVVRLNDRGSGNPGRLVEVSKRTATLLGFASDGKARVRLQVLPNESQAAADAVGGAPSLDINAAPRGVVEIAVLLPPPGVREGKGQSLHRSAEPGADPAAPVAPPLRLPETVTQTTPKPTRIVVRLDAFSEYQYAARQCAKMGWSRTHIVSIFEGRSRRFQTESDPLPDITQADAVLRHALAAGIPDAHIVVE